MNTDRGTGRTTAQIKAAPQAAIFVWCNGHLHYARALAHSLDRRDLKIVSPGWLETAHGISVPIVIDHAARLTERQREGLQRNTRAVAQ